MEKYTQNLNMFGRSSFAFPRNRINVSERMRNIYDLTCTHLFLRSVNLWERRTYRIENFSWTEAGELSCCRAYLCRRRHMRFSSRNDPITLCRPHGRCSSGRIRWKGKSVRAAPRKLINGWHRKRRNNGECDSDHKRNEKKTELRTTNAKSASVNRSHCRGQYKSAVNRNDAFKLRSCD